MSGFPPGTVVQVEEFNNDFWKLLKMIEYKGSQKLFQVPVGELTDFASVPKVLVWFIPRSGKYTKAAILHDYLWEKEVFNGMSYLDADNLFRQAMHGLGVSFLQRWLMWTAVRLAAFCKPNGWAGAWKELPRFLILLIFGIFIALIPSILPLLARLVFHFLEWIIWVLQQTNNVQRTMRKLEPKKVNKPEFSWKL